MTEGFVQIRLDPFNPGQFFACCGLLELLTLEEPDLLSNFTVDAKRPRVASFCIETSRGSGVLAESIARLRGASVEFPYGQTDAVKPALISYSGQKLLIDWWLDEFWDKTTSIKCWAGQVTTRRLFTELLPLVDLECTGANVFERAAFTNSAFGVDPRSAWNTLDLGFSPNEHQVASTVFPAVEVLATIGLQFFRPNSRKRSAVHYSLWTDRLPARIARLAFAAPWDGMPAVHFVFAICKRGQSYKYFSFAKNAEKESAVV